VGSAPVGAPRPLRQHPGCELVRRQHPQDLPRRRRARQSARRRRAARRARRPRRGHPRSAGRGLYGADAISGVVNIVTRHDGGAGDGSARTVTVRTGLGAAGSAFADRPALAQEHAVFLRAGTGARTGGLSLAASTLGAYAPGAAARRLVATGDLRRVSPAGTITASARLADAATSAPPSPLLRRLAADSGAPDQRLRQLTAGVTATRAGGSRWTHTLTAGVDAYQLAGVAADVAPLAVALDSAQRAATGRAGRATLRASSAATVTVAPRVRATLTGLADYGLLGDATATSALRAAAPPVLPAPGSLVGTLPYVRILAARNAGRSADVLAAPAGGTVWLGTAGVVGQATVAVDDALFVTAGLRGERNDGFTAASRFAALPTLGVAAVRPLGSGAGAGGATLKLRAAYGSGLRPTRTPARTLAWRGGAGFGADLRPEAQRGLELGVDLLAGGGRPGVPTVTAGVTRFDQRASGLLQQVAVTLAGDRPRLRGPGSPNRVPGAWRQDYRIENVGEIDNQGWELETAVQRGALSVGATASFVDSRVRRTAVTYTGDLRAGDRMLQVPRRTVGAFAAWRAGAWSATGQLARASDWINYDRLALAALPADAAQPVGAALRPFWLRYSGITQLNATVGRDVARGLTVVVSGSNLLDRQRGEPDNITVLPGRTVTAGVRATF
jgi:iron complex outermembrane receptor protein